MKNIILISMAFVKIVCAQTELHQTSGTITTSTLSPTPTLTAGSGCSVTGTWPAWTFTCAGSGSSVVPAAARNPLITDDQSLNYLIPGQIQNILVTAAGSGYTTAPTCTVTAPSSGTTATCTASIYSGAVVFAGVTLAGNGYISGPVSVTFSGGSGSGATATAYPRSPVASNSNPLYPIWNPSTSVGSNNQSFVMNQSYPTGSARWQTQGVNQLPCDVLASQGCYGIRKQKAGYTGNAINVTCISGSPTFDVPFTSSGSLDSTYLSQCTVAATSVLASYWGAYINTWYDQSGNANNLTQSNTANKPIIAQYTLIGGVPSVMFQSSFFNPAGGYEFLNIPNGVTANQKQFGVFGAMRFDNQLDQSSGITLGTSTSVNFYQNNGGMADSLCGALYVYPAAGAQTFSWWADNTNRHYSNWGDNTSDGYQCAAGNNGATAGGTIGSTNASYSGNEYAGVMIINSVPTNAQVQQIRQSFGQLYNVQEQSRDIIGFGIDSITAGSTSTNNQNYPRQVEELLLSNGHAVKMEDTGIPGLTLSSACSASPFAPSINFDLKLSNKIWFYLGGTNDIAAASSATPVYANLTKCIQQAQAIGWTVIVSTVLPAQEFSSGTPLATWTALNTMIRANTAGANLVCDLQADPTIGPAGAWSNALYYNGDLHPTSLGYSYMAQIASSCISSLLH